MQRYVINFSMTYGRWFSWGTPISTINKTDFHDITELLLKVALNTITLKPMLGIHWPWCCWYQYRYIDIMITNFKNKHS
jgi:hypothetical protein